MTVMHIQKSAACSFGYPVSLVNCDTGISKQIIHHVYPLVSVQHHPTEGHNEALVLFLISFSFIVLCV